MSIKEALDNQTRRIMNNEKITLSGEINIQNKNIKESILKDDDLFECIDAYMFKFKKYYPYIKVEVLRGLHEISIKLFAYKKDTKQENFLTMFKDNLEELISKINDLGDLKIRLNAYGDINTFIKVDEFRIVSDGTQTQYKITDTTIKNEVYKVFIDNIFGKEQKEDD